MGKPSPALVISVIALVFAMTGTGIAAKTLITGKQIKDGTISRSDLSKALRTQLARTGTPGVAGAPGVKGDAGAPGAKGEQGAPGPGAQSYDGQFDVAEVTKTLAVVSGVELRVACPGPSSVSASMRRTTATQDIWGWGTQSSAGTVSGVGFSPTGPGGGVLTGSVMSGEGVFDLTFHATEPGAPVRYVHFSVDVARTTTCTYHAMVTPSS